MATGFSARKLPAAQLTIISAAAFQVLGGLTATLFAVGSNGMAALSASSALLLNLATFAVGALVLLGAARDRASAHLGTFFLITASSFGAALAASDPGLLARLLSATRVEALLPYPMWLFVCSFPRATVPPALARRGRIGSQIAAACGVLLVVVNVATELGEWFGLHLPASLGTLRRDDPFGLFWFLVFAMTLAALPYGLVRARYAVAAERNRALLFVCGLTLGLAPLITHVLLTFLVPAFAAAMDDPWNVTLSQLIVYPALLSIPLTTAYAVLVERVLDVRVAVGMALRYTLARGTIAALSAIPFLTLLGFLIANRDRSITVLLSGPETLVLATATLAGLAALRFRARLLATVDRRFFREEYDAGEIIATLTTQSRTASDALDLAGLIPAEIDEALHLEGAELLTLTASNRLESPGANCPPLNGRWTLAALLRGSDEPLHLDSGVPGSPMARLAPVEREWITETGFSLLVPMFGVTGDLVGAIGLGRKRSELPFSQRDERFLTSVAASAGLLLERHVTRSGSSTRPTAEVPPPEPTPREEDNLAGECSVCGAVFPDTVERCISCGTALVESLLPWVLGAKYRLEKRVGAGGMGVVYSAMDQNLRRRVALKVLPQASQERLLRMRREARAMAAVSHPHLASLFGLEGWRSGWVLVMEFVDGGTLADRLHGGPLPINEGRQLGIHVADALACLHEAGILHRDVKPSNIGVNGQQTKLMDFGVVRIFSHRLPWDVPTGTTTLEPQDPLSDRVHDPLTTTTGKVVGSPLYLAPEALRGEKATPGSDIWSLSLVLYEAIAGRNPFREPTVGATLARISEARPPDIRTFKPACPADLAQILARGLARRPGGRFDSAIEFKTALEQVR